MSYSYSSLSAKSRRNFLGNLVLTEGMLGDREGVYYDSQWGVGSQFILREGIQACERRGICEDQKSVEIVNLWRLKSAQYQDTHLLLLVSSITTEQG